MRAIAGMARSYTVAESVPLANGPNRFANKLAPTMTLPRLGGCP